MFFKKKIQINNYYVYCLFFFIGAVAGENVTSLTLSAAGGGERWGVVNFLAPPSQKSIDNLKGVVKAMSVISF